jgi:uncharacterized hydrophobic protein (TIGR00271 family)
MLQKTAIIKRFIRQLFDLKSTQEEENKTFLEIKEGVEFKGKNLWLLAFAIFIACIGLNINSKSAVIGAMILSPVMGPIFGIGFSLGVSNSDLFKTSLKNAFRIVLVSVFFSTLYYLINPYSIETEELISFSKPTFFDVLLAFIGGLAAMLAISRESGTQVIIAVAVATSCIPPLCTAGFGLATLNLDYFLGGLYTYGINSLFIGFGTLLMTKYLKFERHSAQNIKHVNGWFFVLGILALIPAVYFAYVLAVQNMFQSKVEHIINNQIETKYHVINYDINAELKTIELDISTPTFDAKINQNINAFFVRNNIKNIAITIHQSTEENQDLGKEIKKIQLKIMELKKAK